jgi:phosphotransferase system HPr (HPr) family protein
VATREVRINNPSGLHARPATKFAEAARRFRCRVVVHKGNERVDGKNIMEMLLLAAPAGTVLRLEVEGEDADDCLEQLTAVLRTPSQDA